MQHKLRSMSTIYEALAKGTQKLAFKTLHHSKLNWELSHDLLLCHHWCQALILLQPHCAIFCTLSVAYSIRIPHTTTHHSTTHHLATRHATTHHATTELR